MTVDIINEPQFAVDTGNKGYTGQRGDFIGLELSITAGDKYFSLRIFTIKRAYE